MNVQNKEHNRTRLMYTRDRLTVTKGEVGIEEGGKGRGPVKEYVWMSHGYRRQGGD